MQSIWPICSATFPVDRIAAERRDLSPCADKQGRYHRSAIVCMLRRRVWSMYSTAAAMWSYASIAQLCLCSILGIDGSILAKRIRTLKRHAQGEFPTWIKDPQGDWIAGRLVALRQSAEVTRRVRERMLRRGRRDQEPVSELSLELAEYFMLWTSLKKLRTAEFSNCIGYAGRSNWSSNG